MYLYIVCVSICHSSIILVCGLYSCRSLEFVVCERAHFSLLCRMPCSGLEMVAEEEELQGYKVAIIQEWALNRARYYHIHNTCIHIRL